MAWCGRKTSVAGPSPRPDGKIERRAGEGGAAAGEGDGERIALADEAGDERRGGRVVDLVGRADLLDPALVQDDDAVGEFERLLLVVGDEDGGVAGLVVDLAQPAAQLAADLGVERAEGLVEQQQARLDGQRAGQRDALALAAGELGRIALLEPVELDQLEEFAARARGSRPSPGRSARGRAPRPKATLSKTLMWRNRA